MVSKPYNFYTAAIKKCLGEIKMTYYRKKVCDLVERSKPEAGKYTSFNRKKKKKKKSECFYNKTL